MTSPLNLYSINTILPYLPLVCQNKFFDRGLHIFSFFLFFYPLKLVIGFANVTSFKLKIMTLILTSTIHLNFSYGDHSLSHMTHLLSFLLFILFFSYRISITHRESLLRSYFFFLYRGLHNFYLILLN